MFVNASKTQDKILVWDNVLKEKENKKTKSFLKGSVLFKFFPVQHLHSATIVRVRAFPFEAMKDVDDDYD
uniref:SFRICE_038275 n=1 Tax=Spodoptera frugiperda TaxID=7108 RepID=A0A2H1V2S9_SPOFR